MRGVTVLEQRLHMYCTYDSIYGHDIELTRADCDSHPGLWVSGNLPTRVKYFGNIYNIVPFQVREAMDSVILYNLEQ